MSRQAIIATVVTAIGVITLGAWSLSVERAGITAGLWLERVGPDASAEFVERVRGPLTGVELARIEQVARHELALAFAMTCVHVTDSRAARYRVRVEAGTLGFLAGQSRPLPGLRGDGVISFASIAASAVAFAPRDANREVLVDAIGRGLGRTAAHEVAHQLLGILDIHDPQDRLSYEYPDLRPEHFYGQLHWTIAAAPLTARVGGSACRSRS